MGIFLNGRLQVQSKATLDMAASNKSRETKRELVRSEI